MQNSKLLKLIQIKFLLLIISIVAFLNVNSQSSSPPLGGNYCPGVFYNRTFVFSTGGVVNTDVELRNATNLLINSQGTASANYQADI